MSSPSFVIASWAAQHFIFLGTIMRNLHFSLVAIAETIDLYDLSRELYICTDFFSFTKIKRRTMFASFQTVDKVAKPHRVIKRNSIGVPDKLKIWWGKGERNEVFIMNFKEIHSNAEFLSTYRRARRFPLQGKCHEVTKGFAESQICSCRNKI